MYIRTAVFFLLSIRLESFTKCLLFYFVSSILFTLFNFPFMCVVEILFSSFLDFSLLRVSLVCCMCLHSSSELNSFGH